MHIAILNANTDRSSFAMRWPDDIEKFSLLLKEVKPDWNSSGYDLTLSQRPVDLTEFDGYIITGSPASVNSKEAWVEQSTALLRKLIELKQPVFGACFGHQLLAKAMGAEVVKNPNGWVLGTVETQLHSQPNWVANHDQFPKHWLMYGAHTEQVASLPQGTQIMCQNNDCHIGGFFKDSTIFSTQYHPEMTPEFIQALTEELKSLVSSDVYEKATASLTRAADRALFAKWIVGFFESAKLGNNNA